jgi:hypothetical protein
MGFVGGESKSALEEVSDAAHAVVHEGHLEEEVDVGLEQGPHALGPISERLGRQLAIDSQDPATFPFVTRKDVRFMLETLVLQQPRERSERLSRGRP